jgi:hypothetical protein
MTDRPILFSAPMVRAILRAVDPKTQTRRVVKLPSIIIEPGEPEATSAAWLDQHESGPGFYGWMTEYPEEGSVPLRCPYGQAGDRLWVREAFAFALENVRNEGIPDSIIFRADGNDDWPHGWRPSIHMPRWASRITLEVTGVRVERLQDISEADALAEGVSFVADACARFGVEGLASSWCDCAVTAYSALWESINGPGSLAANPYVWVVEFRRLP